MEGPAVELEAPGAGEAEEVMETEGLSGEAEDVTLDIAKEINENVKPAVRFVLEDHDEAEKRLDSLEGVVALEGDDEDIAWMFEEDSDVESRVHCSLKEHDDFWVQTGAVHHSSL